MKIGFRTKTFTYTQLYELAQKIALYFDQEALGKGDNVLICAPNSPYWLAVFWACALRGIVIVPLNVQSTVDFIERIAQQTKAKLVITHLFFHHDMQLPGLKNIIIEYLPDHVTSIDTSNFKAAAIDGEDLMQIMYTSGTTGEPKGVMLAHNNMASNLLAITNLIGVNLEHDRILSILPLSHIFEQTAGFLLPFSKGVHIIYTHSYGAMSELMQHYRITKMAAVPEFLQLFMARINTAIVATHKEKLMNILLRIASAVHSHRFSRLLFHFLLKKLGALDTVASGGAYLDPYLEERWNLLGVYILQGYGLTETSPCVTTNSFEEHRIGSVGKVIAGVCVKIADDGEILVKGPNVFKGYYQNEEKTREAFTQDGWFKTGDLGYFDEDGFLYIKGRKKYMILKPGGQNVYPEDVELELNKIPGVQDSCVVGLEREGGRVEIHAVLLLAPDASLKPAEIIAQANKHLASYQQITAYSVWPDIDFPRTVTRKIKKNDIMSWLNNREKQTPITSVNRTKLTIMLSQISGVPLAKIQPESELIKDLNLDSLMRVELVAWIEQELGTQVAEADIKQTTTVQELEEVIKAKKTVAPAPSIARWPRWLPIRIVRLLLQKIIFFFSSFIVRVRVEGLEHVQHVKFPVIFMPNHVSYLDAIAVAMALPWRMGMRVAFAGARDVLFEEFWYIAWLGELLFNAFPIQRGSSDNIRLGLDYMGQTLDEGYSLVVFPEGAMSKDGSLQPLKPGTGLLAVEMDVPIVPILLQGTRDILPYDAIRPRKRGTVIVRFGKSLRFKKSDSYEHAQEEIAKAMEALAKKN